MGFIEGNKCIRINGMLENELMYLNEAFQFIVINASTTYSILLVFNIPTFSYECTCRLRVITKHNHIKKMNSHPYMHTKKTHTNFSHWILQWANSNYNHKLTWGIGN